MCLESLKIGLRIVEQINFKENQEIELDFSMLFNASNKDQFLGMIENAQCLSSAWRHS